MTSLLLRDQTDTLPAASAAELVPNVLGFLSFGAYQQCREGDPDAWANQVLHIIYQGLRPGEDTPALTHGANTVFTVTTDTVQWVQIYGLSRHPDANDDDDEVLSRCSQCF